MGKRTRMTKRRRRAEKRLWKKLTGASVNGPNTNLESLSAKRIARIAGR